MKQTTKLAAADLVLPHLVPLCLKFSYGEKIEFCGIRCIETKLSFYIG